MPKLAPRILGYAARHDYPDILDIAAPLVVCQENLSETLPKLPGDMIMRWVFCLFSWASDEQFLTTVAFSGEIF